MSCIRLTFKLQEKKKIIRKNIHISYAYYTDFRQIYFGK